MVLDNAADEDQVRPLLPDHPGCLTLVTSRRRLAGLHPATHLTLDVFTPDEALDFLKRIRPGWTVTDHADRLDERRRGRRLDSGVELALSQSYQHLPAQRRRLLRILALHPGHDIDSYAAAALADTDPGEAAGHLRQLCDDHLLQQTTPGRYVLHDLVRAYAADRASDEDRPPERRAALTRLLDVYLHTAAAAMDTLLPTEISASQSALRCWMVPALIVSISFSGAGSAAAARGPYRTASWRSSKTPPQRAFREADEWVGRRRSHGFASTTWRKSAVVFCPRVH